MSLSFTSFVPRLCVAAGLVLGAVAAQAAGGYTVAHNQESQVAPGMSMQQVRQALGTPERHVKYRNEPGPTYTYRVRGEEQTLFDVDFGADGRVLTMNERMDPSGGNGGHGGR